MNTMSIKKLEKEVHEQTKNIIKAISNETRFSILLLIVVYREMTLDKISELVNKSKSTVHHHITQLLKYGLIEETTKPGSKTRYYKQLESDINKRLKETFNWERFQEQLPEEKEELCELYTELAKTNNIMMLNALQFLIRTYYSNLDDLEVDKRYYTLGELMMGTFNLSEESSLAYRKEHKELAQKYIKKDREHPERKKPHAHYYAGYNVEKTLERLYKKKK